MNNNNGEKEEGEEDQEEKDKKKEEENKKCTEDENSTIKKEILEENINIELEKEENNLKKEILNINNNNKYEENIEKDYLGKKGIIKRTIGTGKVNVKVYEDDEEEVEYNENNFENKEKNQNINNNIKPNNDISEELKQETKIENNLNNNINNQIKSDIESTKKEINEKGVQSNSLNNEAEPLNAEIEHDKEDKIHKNKKDIIKNKYMSFNIDGKKFIIDVFLNFEYNDENQKVINIKLSTIYPGSQIIHWAIYKSNAPKEWSLPPKSYYPKFTKDIDNKALETEFCKSDEKEERIISINLPRKLNSKEYIEGIYFVVYDPVKNIWYNNFRRNFKIKFNS